MTKVISVNIVLSCGHVIKEFLEAVMLKPEIGDIRFCKSCFTGEEEEERKNSFSRTIQKVGVPFWEGEEESKNENPEQLDFLGQLGL